MINTFEKQKLPKGFSYPLGAEKLSGYFEHAPQASKMSFRFWLRGEYWASKWQSKLKNLESIALLKIEYAPICEEWWVFIYAVPSKYNVVARERIKKALPKLCDQLQNTSVEPGYFSQKIVINLGNQNVA